MKHDLIFDRKTGLFRGCDPRKLSPQQRANWHLMQAVLDSEYDRGFHRGLVQGHFEAATTAYNEFREAAKEHGVDLETYLCSLDGLEGLERRAEHAEQGEDDPLDPVTEATLFPRHVPAGS